MALQQRITIFNCSKDRALNCLCHEIERLFNQGYSFSYKETQSASHYTTYFVLFQLLFVFVIEMFLVNNLSAKPLYLEDLDDKLGIFERKRETQHLPVNQTSQSRKKRDVLYGIRDLCPGTFGVSSKPASGCVKTWLYCKYNDINLIEPQCADLSYGCLRNIPRFGFPKCSPTDYQWKLITLPSGQKKLLKLNTACGCARLA